MTINEAYSKDQHISLISPRKSHFFVDSSGN